MPEESKDARRILKGLTESGAVNFNEIGKVVQDVGPQLLSSAEDVASDYIATGYSSVVHVYKTGVDPATLDSAEKLRTNIRQVLGPNG